MYLLYLALLLLLLKYFEIGMVADWPWLAIALPFGLTALWWAWADWSGYTKRKMAEKENTRKRARIERDHKRLGLNVRNKRR